TVTFLTGYSFLGQGQNTAQAFITLKDWLERHGSDSAEAIVAGINRTFAPLRDGRVSALQPPPIDNLANSSGFSFRLQDRGQRGYAELMRAKDQLLAAAEQSPQPAQHRRHHRSQYAERDRQQDRGMVQLS